MAKNSKQNSEQVFNRIKNSVILFFQEEMKNQALEHTLAKIDRIFSTVTGNSKGQTFHEVEQNLEEFWKTKDFAGIYNHFTYHFQQLINNDDYQGILQVFNNKSLINRSEICSICNLKCGNKNLLNYILEILKKDDDDSEIIKKAVINNIMTQ